MLSEEVLDKVIERLARRIEKANLEIIKTIAGNVAKLKTLSPTEAHQLVQMLRYGADYDKIVNEIAKITKLNKKEIKKIFEEVAKSDYRFAEQFYKYRNKKYLPYEKTDLKKKVDALAEITANQYQRISKTIAFRKTIKGKVKYEPIAKAYHRILDEAILNIAQGKETFEMQMRKAMKEMVDSGVRTIDYESGRSLRLDSAVRMHIKDALRNLHNEIQNQIAEEIDADGVEVSVHEAPAPDHAEVQGHQFSTAKKKGEKSEWEKLQTEGKATTYDGIAINLHLENSKGKEYESFRPISAMNCYHVVQSIVLGVNKQRYSEEQLKKIREDNLEGFTYKGKKYTLYEGTQKQRQMEINIRRLKDQQIAAKKGTDQDWLLEIQSEINSKVKEYDTFSKAGKLPTKMERLQVEGYQPVKIRANS